MGIEPRSFRLQAYGLTARPNQLSIWRWGKREFIYLLLRCHHQNDSSINWLRWAAIRAISFNVSLIVRVKVTNKTVSTDHNFWRKRRAEADSNQGPSAYQPSNALLLHQTGSQRTVRDHGTIYNIPHSEHHFPGHPSLDDGCCKPVLGVCDKTT